MKSLARDFFHKNLIKQQQTFKPHVGSHDMPLIFICRVRNGGKYIRHNLTQFQKLNECGKMLIFNDHSTDNTLDICRQFSKVTIINSPFHIDDFNECRDRNFIMNEAKKYNPDFVVSLDSDEAFEEPRFFEIMPRLLYPDSPQVLQYVFPLFNLWNNENTWRGDRLYGQFQQARMWKNLPNQYIPPSQGDDTNLSGTVPWFDSFNSRLVLLRIKHFGTMDENDRIKKQAHYEKLYREKGVSPLALGLWEDEYKKLYKVDKLEPEMYAWHINKPPDGFDSGMKLYKWKDKVSISLNCMGKNCEKELPRLINSVKFVTEQLVYIDTGSADKSREVAKSLGCEVHDFPWINDYSAPRNEALKYTTGTDIIRLDMDEVIDQDDLLKIWYIANIGDFDGFIFPVKNYLEDPMKKQNAEWFYSQTIRLFRNLPGIKFNKLVHEEIVDSFTGMPKVMNIGLSPAYVHHFGYLTSKQFQEKKFDAYYKLCKKQLEQTPNDFYMYHAIAVHMAHIGKEKEAIDYFNKSLEINPNSFLSYAGIGDIAMKAKDYFLAEEMYMKALGIDSKLRTKEAEYMLKKNLIEVRVMIQMDETEHELKEKDEREKREKALINKTFKPEPMESDNTR